MSEIKTRFPKGTATEVFPKPKQAKPDVLPGPLQEITTQKSTKEEVSYQDSPKNGKRCINCSHFDNPSHCYGVNGEISLNGWCSHFDEIKGLGMPLTKLTK